MEKTAKTRSAPRRFANFNNSLKSVVAGVRELAGDLGFGKKTVFLGVPAF